MKKKMTLMALCFLTLTLSSCAKGQGGIYMNAADYTHHILSYQASCKEKFKIHLHDFFGNTASFTISSDGIKRTMQKKAVYGYGDCNDNVYRFYANAVYKIAEAGHIYIYTQERNVTQTKGFIVVNDYFFSTSADGAILRLTTENLANAYVENERFLGLLENFYGDVTAYDARHKMFKINYLYSISQK